jgi:hypothetical protein
MSDKQEKAGKEIIMHYERLNERLSQFQNFVEGNSDDPNAKVTLSLISEFKKEAKENEEELARSRHDPRANRKRRFMAWFGRLRQFQEWLKSKGDDHTTALVLKWIAEFEHKQVEKYVKESVQSFLGDPPDNDFLCGFLSAMLVVEEEALGLPLGSPPFAEAQELVERYVRDKRDLRDAA